MSFASAFSKAEDAAAYMLSELAASAGIDTITVYKGGDGSTRALPGIIISGDGIAVPPDTKHCSYGTKRVALSVAVESQADDKSRAEHANICGGVEAAFIASADQAVALMTSAAVTGFTPKAFYFIDARAEYDESRRRTVYNFAIEANC